MAICHGTACEKYLKMSEGICQGWGNDDDR